MYTQAQYEQHDERQTEDHLVLLSHVSWDDYEQLLAMRGDHSAPRIAYRAGEVEIMSPSRTHEGIKSVIGRLVETYCLERNVPFSTHGPWTLEDQERERGAEPDECCVFGTGGRPPAPRDPGGLDPRPDRQARHLSSARRRRGLVLAQGEDPALRPAW